MNSVGDAVGSDLALPHDERRAEVAQPAEEMHALAERVDDDFERGDVALDRRDAIRLGRAEHASPTWPCWSANTARRGRRR